MSIKTHAAPSPNERQLIGKQPQQSKILLIIPALCLEGGQGESASILREFECPEFDWIQMSNRQMSSRSGHAVDRGPGALQDTVSGEKAVTHTTHSLFVSSLLPCYLKYLYPHFYLPLSCYFPHLSLLHRAIPVPPSPSPPSSPLLFLAQSLISVPILSLCSRSSAPQRFFKLLPRFNGWFLFTLQVKQCN